MWEFILIILFVKQKKKKFIFFSRVGGPKGNKLLEIKLLT